MTPLEFIHKWQQANLSERSACQQHFPDLCEMLDQPKPAAAAAGPELTERLAASPQIQYHLRRTDGRGGWSPGGVGTDACAAWVLR